jgi:uncharacterized protein (TIRG00374 family)
VPESPQSPSALPAGRTADARPQADSDRGPSISDPTPAPAPVISAPGADPAPEVAAAPKRRSRRKFVVRLGLELAFVLAALIFVIERTGKLGSVGQLFGHLRWRWMVMGLGAEAGSILTLSWLQERLLRVGDLDVRLGHLLPVTMASNAVAQSVPAGSIFAEGYAFHQYQRLGASNVLGAWAELASGAMGAAGLAGVALAGGLLVDQGLAHKLVPPLAVVFVGALVAAGLFRRTRLLTSLISWVIRRLGNHASGKVERALNRAEAATEEMVCFQPSARLWTAALLAAAGNWLLDALVLVAGLLAVGANVPWRDVIITYAAAQLLVELPLTPGGLGVVEGGLVELLTRFHVPASQATAATIVYRIFSFWLLIAVGWLAALYLSVRNRQHAAQRVPAGSAAG